MKKITQIFLVLFCAISFAQTTVSGKVTDDSGQPLPGANIIVLGTTSGTVSDFEGNFSLTVNQNPPFVIQVSSVGFQTTSMEVTSNAQTLDVVLVEGTSLDEIVIAASRTPESIRESPVTIERLNVQDIKLSASPSFYNSLENLKGVDLHQGSLTFNSVNTRGFATYANNRFVQLVDGMDNAPPVLNFVIGNLLGLNELDVQSVELLPGASSALYGANAFNGILFMNSKNAFDHPGVSFYYKQGITSQKAAGDNSYTDFGIRTAYKFSDKFAAKASFSYMKGTDWHANDTNEYVLGAIGTADAIIPYNPSSPNHDGLNIYGDEISMASLPDEINGQPIPQNLDEWAQYLVFLGQITPLQYLNADVPQNINVARTGYKESDLTDYDANSLKADVTLNYRPFANDIEIEWKSKIGRGSSIYQGANRYQIKDFTLQQHKLEIRGDNFFLRGYTTSEGAGNSYDMRFTGINMNKVGLTDWFANYAGAFVTAKLSGATNDQAYVGARQFADDVVTPQPGTDEFKALFNKVISDPDVSKGSKFLDNSKMYVGEGNYNFRPLLNDAMDLQVGGSWRQYSLNSSGTIFTDYDGSIDYNEYGAYVQAIKKFDDDRFKITASVRYDYNDVVKKDSYSPRISLNYAAGPNKEHNFRASFQTGFRNPDTQSLFIGFNVGRAILVGGAEDNLDRRLPGTTLTGRDAYTDSYTLSSIQTVQATGDITQLHPVGTVLDGDGNVVELGDGVTPLVKQEQVSAFDVGYRGKLGPFTIDLNGYFNIYDDFLAEKLVVTPNNGSVTEASGFPGLTTGALDVINGDVTVFQVNTNSTADVKSWGAVLGVSTKLGDDFDLGFNYTYAHLDFDQESEPDFSAGFNTPEHKFKVSFGSDNLFENFGFSIDTRWSDTYFWQASIANANIPARWVVDAQINYSIPALKSIFKVGGTNLGGQEYQSAVGSPFIGSMYYVSWVISN